MERLKAKIPYDHDVAHQYPEILDFIPPMGGKFLYVREGTHAAVGLGRNLVSEGFTHCTCLLFTDREKSNYGLFHVLPSQWLTEKDAEDLAVFAGGFLLALAGSSSWAPEYFVQILDNYLKFQEKELIPLKTLDQKRGK